MEKFDPRRDDGDAVARQAGATLAVAVAATAALLALGVDLPGLTLAVDRGRCLAAAGAFLALGGLVRRGQRGPAYALMALATGLLLRLHLAAPAWASLRAGDHPGFWAARLVVCGLAWVLWMRVFTGLARRERRAARPAGPDR